MKIDLKIKTNRGLIGKLEGEKINGGQTKQQQQRRRRRRQRQSKLTQFIIESCSISCGEWCDVMEKIQHNSIFFFDK